MLGANQQLVDPIIAQLLQQIKITQLHISGITLTNQGKQGQNTTSDQNNDVNPKTGLPWK